MQWAAPHCSQQGHQAGRRVDLETPEGGRGVWFPVAALWRGGSSVLLSDPACCHHNSSSALGLALSLLPCSPFCPSDPSASRRQEPPSMEPRPWLPKGSSFRTWVCH